MNIVEAAESLRAGRLSSRALIEAALTAHSIHGPHTNAFIRLDADRARARADAADVELRAGRDRGPLHGIPISLKDLIDEAGFITTAASRVLEANLATTDATIVTRLREAGAISIGKTNLHEFALGTTSDDSAYGPVRHPGDTGRLAGGSSGGSAAAVATGMGLASIGTDTGGSIRIPAACCGVVGLKPSTGDVPLDGIVPLSSTLDHAGPLATTVQDAAWLWAVLAGRTPDLVEPVSLAGLRLTRLVGYFEELVMPEVREPYEAALAKLSDEGAVVTSLDLPLTDGIAQAYLDIVLPEAAHWHALYLDTRADRYSPIVGPRIRSGREVTSSATAAARAFLRALRGVVDQALATADALVLPTLPIVAPPVGATDIATPGTGQPVPVRMAMLRHTQPFSMTGHPAISLPIATTRLPVGLQIVGPWRQTARLLAIAAASEKIVGPAPDAGRR
ncbi:MAG TPA: amidase [Vicinamibacterales bacterium]|nr:amidase [Vicinamibacterales bacterium]